MPEPAASSAGDLRRGCWGGTLAALCAVLQLWPGASEALRFERLAFSQGAVWQPLSAQWVHLNWPHAAANAAAAVLLCWLLRPWMPLSRQLLALLGGWLGVAVLLVFDTRCAYYAGASGALHGVLAGAALHALAQAKPMRYVGAALLLGLVLKLGWQAMAQTAAPGWLGIPVYHPAHIAGAVGGALVLAACLLMQGLRAAPPQ